MYCKQSSLPLVLLKTRNTGPEDSSAVIVACGPQDKVVPVVKGYGSGSWLVRRGVNLQGSPCAPCSGSPLCPGCLGCSLLTALELCGLVYGACMKYGEICKACFPPGKRVLLW